MTSKTDTYYRKLKQGQQTIVNWSKLSLFNDEKGSNEYENIETDL